MTGDPYEEANDQGREESARLIPPERAKKSNKLVLAGLVLAGIVVGLVILANVAKLLTDGTAANTRDVPKPRTMTTQQSKDFARQQAGQASYIQGHDRDTKAANAEDTVLGQAGDVAGDPYDEADGTPMKTKAQDDAEHGRTSTQGGSKSAAQDLRETAELVKEHRRENDLDSSAASVDFTDYFDRDKAPSPGTKQDPDTGPSTEQTHPHVPLVDPPADGSDIGRQEPRVVRPPHDPKEDYVFDSSSGKLYRLMEDTILEGVLVNRLAGSSVGPVIVTVTVDVYSASRVHLLIPKGTRLLGSVGAVGALNQERLFVAFHRMIMPDGYSVSLDKFQGLDVVGQTGLRDLVNHHYLQIFGSSIALAAIAATTQAGNNSGAYGTYDWGVAMRNGISEGLGQSAQRVMERFINILPTFTIRERARVRVMLAGDLLLPDTKNHTMDPDL